MTTHQALHPKVHCHCNSKTCTLCIVPLLLQISFCIVQEGSLASRAQAFPVGGGFWHAKTKTYFFGCYNNSRIADLLQQPDKYVFVFACQVLLPNSRVNTLVPTSEVVTVAKVVRQLHVIDRFAKIADNTAEPGHLVLVPYHKSCKPTTIASHDTFMMPQLITQNCIVT